MNIGVVVFTYQRFEHTKKTLDALLRSTKLPNTIYVFQDAPCDNTRLSEWRKVNDLITNGTYPNCEVHISKEHLGLADMVVTGIDYVLQTNDAIIVLEDDCVPHPMFIEFVIGALEKYRNEEKVWSINGFKDPVTIEKNGTDAFFIGRTSSWGWATWKDRWSYYERDYRLLSKIKNNKDIYFQYKIWGEDLESYLIGNIEGLCDSWAVFWSLQVIYRGGYCLVPYESLIDNIGLDGSGTHSGDIDLGITKRAKDNLERIIFPDEVEFPANYQEAYIDYYHWVSSEEKNRYYKNLVLKWIEIVEKNFSVESFLGKKNVSTVSIWGTGDLCKRLINEINDSVEIIEIIKNYNYANETSYMQIPICDFSKQEINKGTELIIVIPGYDIEIIKKKLELVGFKNQVVAIDKLLMQVGDEYD